MFENNYYKIINLLKPHWNWIYFFAIINSIGLLTLLWAIYKERKITFEGSAIKEVEKIIKVPVEIIKEVPARPQRRNKVKNPKSIKGFTINAELYNKVITYLDSRDEITSIPFFLQELLENYDYSVSKEVDNSLNTESLIEEKSNETENKEFSTPIIPIKEAIKDELTINNDSLNKEEIETNKEEKETV